MNDITFAKNLSSVMLDNKYDRFVKNRRTGKLDTRSLHKIETSSKLFKKREARKNKNYAVSLVVDCSGSMGGPRIELAALAAKKLSYHLSRMGIPHDIVSFNILVQEAKPFNTKQVKRLEEILINRTSNSRTKDYEYAIWDMDAPAIYSKITKGRELRRLAKIVKGESAASDFCDEGYRNGKRFYSTPGSGYNSDAEAIKFSREKLMKQTGKRIMIHLSDGQPAPFSTNFESPNYPGTSQKDYDLKEEVQKTLRAGIELYAIGIQNDSVNNYYPPKRTATIRTMDQLYPHIIMLIKKNLRRG